MNQPIPIPPTNHPVSPPPPPNTSKTTISLSVISSLLGLAIGLWAVYLSWTCNTAGNVDVILKVVYAIFAFIFGLFYILFYFIFRAGYCYAPKKGGRVR